MRLSTKLSGIVAVGGVAALGAGLISSGGIGASWTDNATADASINVGNMDCALADSTGGASITGNRDAVSFGLGQVVYDKADTSYGSVKVLNTASVPIVASWSYQLDTSSTLTDHFSVIRVPEQVTLQENNKSDAASIGFEWTELNGSDFNTSGKVTYKVDCYATKLPPTTIALLGHDGGYATWNGTAVEATLGSTGSTGVPRTSTPPPPSNTRTPAAGLWIENLDAEIPDEPPTFTFDDTSTDSTSNPYFGIKLLKSTDTNKSVYLTSNNQSAGSVQWTLASIDAAPAVTGDWATVTKAANDAGYTLVEKAFLQLANTLPNSAGTGFNQSGSFTCVKYDHSFVFGNGC